MMSETEREALNNLRKKQIILKNLQLVQNMRRNFKVECEFYNKLL